MNNTKTYFRSGREFEEANNYVGLDSDGGIAFGYDNAALMPEADWDGAKESLNYLSASDCVEIADIMIERWAALRAKYAAPTAATEETSGSPRPLPGSTIP